jgi:hypothetical protein
MTLRPEQTQALRYARRKGSEASCDAIRARVASTFADLETLLGTVPLELTALAPAPGKWSLHQIVDHLVVTHRRAVGEFAALVAGESPLSGPIPAGLVSDAPFARPWPLLLADLASVHRDFVEVLGTAGDDTPLEARAPVVMVVKCATADGILEPVEWVESFDWKAYGVLFRAHTLEHLHQVQRTLAAIAP